MEFRVKRDLTRVRFNVDQMPIKYSMVVVTQRDAIPDFVRSANSCYGVHVRADY